MSKIQFEHNLANKGVCFAQRSVRRARLLLSRLIKIKHLTVQCGPNLLWGQFNKTLHVMVQYHKCVIDCQLICIKYLGMKNPNWQSSSIQSGLTTQIRTRPRATHQGHIKCRGHITIPAVPTQEAIPEEGRYKKKIELLFETNFVTYLTPLLREWVREENILLLKNMCVRGSLERKSGKSVHDLAN